MSQTSFDLDRLIARLQAQLAAAKQFRNLMNGHSGVLDEDTPAPTKRPLSAKGRAAISRAVKLRWKRARAAKRVK